MKFTTDVDPEAGTTLYICQSCFLEGPLDLAMLMEIDNERSKRRLDTESSNVRRPVGETETE